MPRDPGPASDAAVALAKHAGITFTAADWLDRRGFSAGADLDRWLEPKLAHLTPPDAMADLRVAADRIGFALANGERVAVFGDYDCDGVTSAAILAEVVRALGGEAVPLCASRFEGGYGLSAPALDKVKAIGARLLVTCDCGSTDHERLADAKLAGIDAVVIDHHLVPDEPLPALAFLNPHRPECGFPYKHLASCGLALFVATALRRITGKPLEVRQWLDLVAVGTIADVAPLTGDNRALVRRGLEMVSAGARPGLCALARNGAGGRKRPQGSEDIAYQIAPRLNAAGRLADAKLALELLLERDAARAWEKAAAIEELTRRRREIQRRMNEEAVADIARCGFSADPALVLARQGWHQGVVGIVAGRLAETFARPVIVVALDGPSGRGSARAPAGFRLYDSIAACRGDLIGFGGHQAAAGIEVRADRVDAFRDAWRAACAAQLCDLPPPPEPGADVRLDERDDLGALLRDLDRIEPCGQGNPAPRVSLPASVLAAREVKGHLKLELLVRGERLSGFWPENGGQAARLTDQRVAVVGLLRRDHWRGGALPEVLVQRLDSES